MIIGIWWCSMIHLSGNRKSMLWVEESNNSEWIPYHYYQENTLRIVKLININNFYWCMASLMHIIPPYIAITVLFTNTVVCIVICVIVVLKWSVSLVIMILTKLFLFLAIIYNQRQVIINTLSFEPSHYEMKAFNFKYRKKEKWWLMIWKK